MAQLTIRKVDADLVRRLKLRAARHGRSAEAEVRTILETALRPGAEPFWERAASLRSATRGRGGTSTTDLLRRDRFRDLGESDEEVAP